MASLRVGLSGCGRRGAEVVRQVRMHDHCDVVALHDPDQTALHRLRAATGIELGVTDFAALLATGVDFVVLTGPAGDHPEQVRAAAEQGAHCCVHAPMALDAAAAAEMVARCDEAGVKLGVCVREQADPTLEQVRRMIADDWLGAPVAVTSLCADDRALRAPPPPGHFCRDPALVGESVLVQLATEHLHLTTWLVSRAPLQVAGLVASGFSVMPQDTAAVTVQLRGGVLCAFLASHLTRGNAIAVHGTDGAVRLAPDRISLRGRKEWRGPVFDYVCPGEELTLMRADLAAALAPRAADHELHGRFARWVEDTDDFPCPGDQAALDLCAFAAAARAAAAGRAEPVTPPDPPPAPSPPR